MMVLRTNLASILAILWFTVAVVTADDLDRAIQRRQNNGNFGTGIIVSTPGASATPTPTPTPSSDPTNTDPTTSQVSFSPSQVSSSASAQPSSQAPSSPAPSSASGVFSSDVSSETLPQTSSDVLPTSTSIPVSSASSDTFTATSDGSSIGGGFGTTPTSVTQSSGPSSGPSSGISSGISSAASSLSSSSSRSERLGTTSENGQFFFRSTDSSGRTVTYTGSDASSRYTAKTTYTSALVTSQSRRVTSTRTLTSGGSLITSAITTDVLEAVTTGQAVITSSPSLNGSNGNDGGSGLSESSKKVIGGVVGGIGGAIVIGALALVAYRIWGKKNPSGKEDYHTYNQQASLTQDKRMSQGASTTNSNGLERYHDPSRGPQGTVNTSSNF